MKKRIIYLSSFILIILGVGIFIYQALFKPTEINSFIATKIYSSPANKAFTDENFYKCVVDAYNYNKGTSLPYTTSLSDSQLGSIKSLSCNDYSKSDEEKIKNTNGLEKLTALTYLSVVGNQLVNLDVSKNTALTYLNVDSNKLTSLDVSKNTALTYLVASSNQLVNLDVSKNTSLTQLSASSNQLTNLDVSKNIALTHLDVDSNKLTNLDVSKNTALKTLYANKTQLTILDVSKNTALTDLSISRSRLVSLDVSKNKSLVNLWIYNNQLESLNISGATALQYVSAENDITSNNQNFLKNKLTILNVDNTPHLKNLKLSGNKLESLDINGVPSLEALDVGDNELTELDVSKNVLLKALDVDENQLTSLDVSKNTALVRLNAYYNKLTSLDVSKNIALTTLFVERNQLVNLDLSKNLLLTTLYVYGNLFSKTIGIYKNNEMNINILTSPIKLSTEKTNSLTSIKLNNVIKERVDSTIAGNYQYNLEYKHDIQTSSNDYNVALNLYVIEATSNKYDINAEEGYIYTKTDTDEETILSNINLNYGETSIEDNKLIIKYGDEVLKTFKIVNISSTKYDLSKEYIFDNKFSIDNIKVVNGTSEVNNNQLLIKYEDAVLSKYKLVSYNSTKYNLSKDSIKVLDNNIEEFISNIKCINCNVKIFDGNEYKAKGDFGDNDKLRILYGDEVLKEYSLTYGVNGISLVNKKVKLNLDTKNSIKLEYTISPKNADNKEVTWKSSNTDVVTIDNNGVITAKGYGDAVITVATVDGNYSDNCNVNVSEFITYTITYKDGDNSYTEDYEEGDSVTWKSDITKKGYTLVGWKYNDKKYKLSDKFTMINEDITVTSIWNVNKYTIAYEVNGGSINNKTKEVTYDSKYGILEIPSKKGYSFKGWYKDNGFIDIVDEDTIVSDDKDHTLYAKWEINSYKLTINDGINTNEYTLKYNDEKEIVIPERKGYSFVKWNITGTDSTINNNIFKMGTEDSTLVAEWKLVIPEIKNYKIKDKYITGIKLNTKLDSFDLGLDNVYSVKIYDRKNNIKTSGLIATGDKVNIYLDDSLIVSYTSIVKGDVTGTGTSSVSDVAKLYQYLKKKVTMEDYFIEAGNVVDTDNEIKVGDIAKLYQFIKGKVISLE